LLYFFASGIFLYRRDEFVEIFIKQRQIFFTHEKKFTPMEEKRPDALEMAA